MSADHKDPLRQTPLATRMQMADVARIRSTQIADHAIQLAHLVSVSDWPRVAEELREHQQTLNQLAGCVARLLGPNPQGPSLEFEHKGKYPSAESTDSPKVDSIR